VIHYHGTPITPLAKLNQLAGLHFCISFWRPDSVRVCHEIGQSVMLDNGAFSAWNAKKPIRDWVPYYEWADRWLAYPSDWAVIPDVIDGDEDSNDELVEAWPYGQRGAPVWHLHESLERLDRLVETWPRVCLGSSAQYARVGAPRWHYRMFEAMEVSCLDGRPRTALHMLRGMSLSGGPYPFASVDSTDVARNHNRPKNGDILAMARRWDAMQPAPLWNFAASAQAVKINPYLVGAILP
jgi:hypothetical protein